MEKITLYYVIVFEPFAELRWFLSKNHAAKFNDTYDIEGHSEFFNHYKIDSFIGSKEYYEALLNS